MRAFTVFTVLFAVVVGGVLANSREISTALLARQQTVSPDIPTECNGVCAALNEMKYCKVDLNCLCTSKIGQGLADCGACGIEHHSSDPNINLYRAEFQAYVNTYTTSCTDAGYPVGPFDILSDGSPSASSSSTGPTAPTSSPNGAVSVRTGGLCVGITTVVITLVW